VYRAAPNNSGVAPPPLQATPGRRRSGGRGKRWLPDDVLLFRYSALITFNGHRIHYDRRYATEVEGYPGLIVHGPLIATLLLDLLRWQRPEARLRLAFRLLSQV
jgi:3-methylfumaryl-CoA hydratase